MKLGEGCRALVTGASRGLGVEIASRLAARGVDLVLSARSKAALDDVATMIRRDTGRAVTAIQADVGDPDAVSALAHEAEADGQVDVLVNNAGVESTLRFSQRDPAEIAAMVAVNLTGPMLLARRLLPGMLTRGRGHIVNIASVGGVMAVPFNEPYSATKFGLVGFTRSLRLTAKASGWPISASVICPGFIDGAGLFEDLKRNYGVDPEGLWPSPLEDVGPAVIRAVEDDLPDVFVTRGDLRSLAAMSITHPTEAEAGAIGSPGTAMFRAVADIRGAEAGASTVEAAQ